MHEVKNHETNSTEIKRVTIGTVDERFHKITDIVSSLMDDWMT